jgi:hypothetical protein
MKSSGFDPKEENKHAAEEIYTLKHSSNGTFSYTDPKSGSSNTN